MKKVLIILACIMGSLAVNAQDYITKGYRGFGEFGVHPIVTDNGYDCVAITTSHGYQFNPYLFLGGGFSSQYHFISDDYGDDSYTEIAYFVDCNIGMGKRIAPFFDFKLGYTAGDFSGLYLAPAVGVRFLRFNLSVGYELESFATFNSGNTSYYMDETINTGAIMFNFAVDWGARK